MSDRPNTALLTVYLSQVTRAQFHEYSKTRFRNGVSYLSAIGEDGLETLEEYLFAGRPTGDFLAAVMSNDLREALGRADDRNIAIIHFWVGFLVNFFPGIAWGDRDKVKKWLDLHEKAREEGKPSPVGNTPKA